MKPYLFIFIGGVIGIIIGYLIDPSSYTYKGTAGCILLMFLPVILTDVIVRIRDKKIKW